MGVIREEVIHKANGQNRNHSFLLFYAKFCEINLTQIQHSTDLIKIDSASLLS